MLDEGHTDDNSVSVGTAEKTLVLTLVKQRQSFV